jgi:hypothetical protein
MEIKSQLKGISCLNLNKEDKKERIKNFVIEVKEIKKRRVLKITT